MKVLDLFSGIGGFSLGLERAGMETIAFCEIEPYCQKVLKKHWPDVPIYEDVRNVTRERLNADGIFPDIITGGFPCQDISVAGKQAGIEGERSGLWSECARILGEFRPRYAIFENVTALLSGDRGKWFERVLWDISQVGYDAEWHCIPASAIGAHHHRNRVWIVAYPQSSDDRRNTGEVQGEDEQQATKRQEGGVCSPIDASPSGVRTPPVLPDPMCRRQRNGETLNKPPLDEKRNTETQGQGRTPVTVEAQRDDTLADAYSQGLQERPILRNLAGKENAGNQGEDSAICGWWDTEPAVGRVANGIPQRVDRLKGLGNAVVPQIPEIIARAIMEAEQ